MFKVKTDAEGKFVGLVNADGADLVEGTDFEVEAEEKEEETGEGAGA